MIPNPTDPPPPPSAPPPPPAIRPAQEKPSLAIPLIVWLLMQLGAVALAASRVPLSANFPRPPQGVAVHEMLIVQFVGAALLVPIVRRWNAWLALALAAGPMLMLSATMTSLPIGRVVLSWLSVAAWLAALAVWRAVASPPPRGADIVVAAVAVLLSAGGLLWEYLHREFRGGGELISAAFPLLGTLQNLNAASAEISPLSSTLMLCAAGIVTLAVKNVVRRPAGESTQK